MTTYDRILSVFSAVFEGSIDQSEIKPESRLFEDVGINSIGMLCMAMALEEEFGIKFQNEDFGSLRTVGDVADVIEGKL